MSNVWDQNQRVYARILARYWTDDSYKQSLLNNPGITLTRDGFQLPPNATVALTLNGAALLISGSDPSGITLPLPERPASINDATLQQLTSGAAADDHSVGVCCCCSCC